MNTLWQLYHPDIPPFLRALAETPPMRRLKDVGMNCGCEYTSFPLFTHTLPYSRLDHSMGAALIVWHFTQDPCQAVAALLHDVATPAFAHTVDFLHGDYLRQESTEDGTTQIIAASPEIQNQLRLLGLTTGDIADYHRYPIADNDAPRLSSDRLEYTLGNLFHYGFADLPRLEEYYEDLTTGLGEDGQSELLFRTPALAAAFTLDALRTARVYVADEDRFAMQALADLLRDALGRGVLEPSVLAATEPQVIHMLLRDEASAEKWHQFRRYARILRADTCPSTGYWVRVNAKKRFIDPLCAGLGRCSAWSEEVQRALDAFQALDFSSWLSATENL